MPPPLGLRDCFDRLVDLPVSERAAWLDAHDIDAALREQVRKMLAADGVENDAVPLFRAGAAALAAEFTPESDEGAGLIGTTMGPYRLSGVLGQGGTSLVFRAERPMGEGIQVVALKVLRTGLFSADSQRRFRREQGMLSQLSHPNIAGLVDGGIGAGGIPYIAMEFVDGLAITDYATANALDLPARLRLLVTVCRAVNSAHRALVVHRDLKPSNVLVSREGVVKVLDFGIAQLLDDGSGNSAQTQVVSLTPGYAAPEQYQPGPVTTATDIYALGVLLAELLIGRPVAPASFSVLSRACVEAPPEVSAGLPAPAALRRLLRGDLDAIYSTACAAEPDRRYGSVALLAEDLERYLQNLPVSARAPSVMYRLRKYVRRHWIGASAALLGGLAVVIGMSTTLWQARLAHEESQRATAVSNFLMGLFEASKPGQLPEQRLTLEQLVHRASARLQKETDLPTATRIDMLRLLGEVSMDASDFAEAERLLQQALDLGRSAYAADAPALLRIRLLLAQLLLRQNRYADAADAYEAMLPPLRTSTDATSIRALQNYAFALMYSARAEQALAVSTDATQAATAFYGSGSQGAVLASLEHGTLLSGAGQPARAVAVIEPALQHWRDAGWPPDRDFLRGLSNQAGARVSLGEMRAAEQLARESLATGELIYPSPHEQIAAALLNLGDVLLQTEHLDEADAVLARALAMYRAIYGAGHMREANTLTRIGQLQWRRRDLAAAAQSLLQAQPWCARPGLHATRTCINIDTEDARIALAQGNLAQADARSARGLAMARELFRNDNVATAELLELRAGVHLGNGDAAAALAACDDAQAMLRRLGETQGPSAVAVAVRRAAVLDDLRRYPEALTDIQQAVALWQRLAPDGYRRRAEMLAQLAQLQSKSGDLPAARATAQSALALVGHSEQIDPARLATLQSLAAASSRRH
ncbi:serine/threonine-protein kinase [Tahibacter aquaticus]|uniref:Serine/threonine-protein kinase n=1 Tax=Tahibacter aquaticus TaxID=520092 RepID=A0A4R6YN92_9GAMM|nr:serine/threonine-protein kinase [Tahibacter aquaticus]TDR38902.1 serine/threonine-protein kinase [Tahibacter aquaticus]